MEKIKTCWKRASLRIKFGVYVVVGALMCFLAATISSAAFQARETTIYQKYDEKRHMYTGQVVTKEGQPFSRIYYYGESLEDFLTNRERLILQICELGQSVGVALWFVLGLLVTSVLFYRNNLKKPIELMDAAAERISRQELDFTIVSDREDELGRLCESFERMRGALQENYREMWRQMEERKRVNAAFSHDLRTPLTVLKGQSEMLAKYVPDGRIPREKIAMTAETMGRHIARLEAYVETMNRVMRLEDIEVKREPVALEALTAQIAEVGKAICGEKFLMVGEYSAGAGFVAISGGGESHGGESVGKEAFEGKSVGAENINNEVHRENVLGINDVKGKYSESKTAGVGIVGGEKAAEAKIVERRKVAGARNAGSKEAAEVSAVESEKAVGAGIMRGEKVVEAKSVERRNVSKIRTLKGEKVAEVKSVEGRKITGIKTLEGKKAAEAGADESEQVAGVKGIEGGKAFGIGAVGDEKVHRRERVQRKTVVMADVSLVMQVAENLLSNCARYAKETVAVSVNYEPEENMLCLTVEDDGPGFAPEFLEKACQPFFRQDREAEGTNTPTHLGMGLYICRLLCNKHGGGLTIENRKSDGARFQAEFFTPFFKKNSNQ